MKKIKVKICGLKDADNIAAVAALRPDYLGFIFYPASPRYAGELDPEVCHRLPASIGKVGVFVDASVDEIIRTAVRYRLDLIQLHGHESPGECRRVRRILPVIKALPVRDEADLALARDYEGCCDLLLFDTRTEVPGGSGRQFDWSVLCAYRGQTPFLLSGGIGPEDAVRVGGLGHPRLAGCDLNSRFERELGVKDVAALAAFIKQIRK